MRNTITEKVIERVNSMNAKELSAELNISLAQAYRKKATMFFTLPQIEVLLRDIKLVVLK